MTNNKRHGFIFSLDALLAALILIGGVILVSSIASRETDTSQISAASQDVATALSAVHVRELVDPWIIAQVANGSADGNVTVLEQIGYYWATGRLPEAQRLTDLFLNQTYPDYQVRLSLDGETVYSRGSPRDNRTTAVSSRMISGIAEGKAITGSSASAYLRRIKDKRTNSFTVFGGFVGQGNISMRFLDLPTDANITKITLELAAGNNFTIRFNDVPCGGTYAPPNTNGTPGGWDLSACNTSLIPGGVNIIGIYFSAPLNTSYVTGGFLRVKYKTTQLQSNFTNTSQYRFPGINGVVNLFDAFTVRGTLLNLTVYLHYYTSNSSYLEIGDKRVLVDSGNASVKMITLTDAYLKDPAGGMLDYNQLSNNTVPIRFAGFEPNVTFITGGNADVVIITDFSGSMKKAVSDWDQGNLGSTCANAYTDNDIRRTLLAQCVDKVLTDTILNYSGIRVWPVFIYNNEVKWYNNPLDLDGINGYIDSYPNGKDKTCYACALNLAYDIFNNLSNSSRRKFIVFMTDGVPTHCASGSCTSDSTGYGVQQCEGLCDTAGACSASDIPAQCAECTTNNGGQTNAYLAATRNVDDLDVTIFTVGFGPVTDCSLAGTTLQQIASIGNGTYQHSMNSSQLKLIYENISQEILSRTQLESQVVIFDGAAAYSTLYDDSYINITYLPAEQYEARQNMLSLTLQSDQSCSPVVDIYPEQLLVEASAVSYSGVHWTDYLAINGVQAYNLSSFFKPYGELGDPTLLYAPINLFTPGANTFTIETGDSAVNRTGCFINDSAIYTVLINLSTERSTVVAGAQGCTWSIEFEDGTYENIAIPASYIGANVCVYNSTGISYDPDDAYQLGAYQILDRLDFKKEGKLFVNIRDEDLEIIVTTIGGIPYLWGPTLATIEVTR